MNLARKQLTHRWQSYLFVLALGLVAGILTRLSDYCPADSLWSFSSIASAFGFWIVTTTLLIYFSHSPLTAGLNAFLYLAGMSISFYVLKYLLGQFIPRFADGGLQWRLLLIYLAFSLVIGFLGYLLHFWHCHNKFSSILYALPICALGAETIGLIRFFAATQTYLFQLIFDVAGLLLLGIWFYHKTRHKLLYSITVVVGATLGYFLVYHTAV